MVYVLLDIFVAIFIGMMFFLFTDRLVASILVILLSGTMLVSITIDRDNQQNALYEKIEMYVAEDVYDEKVDIKEIKVGENNGEYEVYVKTGDNAEQVVVKYVESVDAFKHDIIQLDTLE